MGDTRIEPVTYISMRQVAMDFGASPAAPNHGPEFTSVGIPVKSPHKRALAIRAQEADTSKLGLAIKQRGDLDESPLQK